MEYINNTRMLSTTCPCEEAMPSFYTCGGGLEPMEYIQEQTARADLLFSNCRNRIPERVMEANEPDCIQGETIYEGELKSPISDIPSRLNSETAVNVQIFVSMMDYFITASDAERDVYFYHSDHLGSASWITDNQGVPVQHLQYLPYGEPFVNQRTSNYNERFTFTGKERDEETGYGYFGARYMDHELMTMWLSVDPMADKYPSISPYAYCNWNPVKLVDPEGRDVWSLSDNGIMTWEKASSHDIIKYKGKKIILQNSNNVFGTGSDGYSFSLKDNQYYTFSDVMDAQKTFELFADNLNYEFSALGYEEDGKKKYDLSTSLSDVGDVNGSTRAVELGDKLRKHFHNHPDGNVTPSDPTNRRGKGDDKTFSDGIRKNAPSCEFYLYTKTGDGNYLKYSFINGKATVENERKSSFIKSSSSYTRKKDAIKNAFSF